MTPCSGKFKHVYSNETLVAPGVFAYHHEPVALERGDEVLALVGHVLKVLLRGKPAGHQPKTKFQSVVNARLENLAHQLVFGLLAAALYLPRFQIAHVGPGFLLNRVIKDQDALGVFDQPRRRLNLQPQVSGRVVTRRWAKNRETRS